MDKRVLLLILACAFFFVQGTEAVKCYSCNSASNDKCGAWSWTTTLSPPPTTTCIGSCTKIVVGDLITRSCSPVCVSATIGASIECCTSDLCNTAISSLPAYRLLAVMVAIVAALWRLLLE